MATFRKRPVEIEAVQWTGGNYQEIRDFARREDGFSAALHHDDEIIRIETLEGVMAANVGDWIIRGVQGEFYPCKPDIFAATYEPQQDAEQAACKCGFRAPELGPHPACPIHGSAEQAGDGR